jgi:hypothetical protein
MIGTNRGMNLQAAVFKMPCPIDQAAPSVQMKTVILGFFLGFGLEISVLQVRLFSLHSGSSFPEEGIEGRFDAFAETGKLGVDDEQNDEQSENDQNPVHSNVHSAPSRRMDVFGLFIISAETGTRQHRGEKVISEKGRGERSSGVSVGLVLELRDFGPFFFSSEMKAEKEHAGKAQQREDGFKKAFHHNLPYQFLNKNEKKSTEISSFPRAP